MSIVVKLETVTPKKAAEYLSKMAPNRPMNMSHVQRLAGAMKEGRWQLNGETIKLNDKGELEDGQQRLRACIIANVPFITYIVRGLPSNNGVFETIDTGDRRTVGDMFARTGERQCTSLAAAIVWLYRYTHGAMFNTAVAPRHDEASAVLAAHPAIRDSITAGRRASKVLAPGVGIFLHYLFAKSDRELADRFFDSLATGDSISATSPATCGIFLLRSKLEENRNSKRKLPREEIPPLVVKAWNLVRSRKTAKLLKWSREEGFPEIF